MKFSPIGSNVERRQAGSFMVLGVGSFAHSIGTGAGGRGRRASRRISRAITAISRRRSSGKPFRATAFPSPVPLLRENKIDVVIPQSIDWALQPWAEDLVKSGVGIFSPTGEAMRIERERDFARELCARFKIPFPKSFVASNRIEAEKILGQTSAAVRHQKSALLADQPDPHDPVRDGRGHAGVAAAGELCRGRFFAGISRPRRGRAHRAGQRRRNLFARHEPGIQIRLQRQPGHRRRRAAGRAGRTR